MKNQIMLSFFAICGLTSCSNNSENDYDSITTYPFVEAEFGSSVDLNNLANYANQEVPSYILKDNSQGNSITDKGATLGRVYFMILIYHQIILFLVLVVINKNWLLVILM
jgi:cytochrome c peroxidase